MPAGLIYISRASLRTPRSYSFYCFFAWEFIVALFLLNVDVWFQTPWTRNGFVQASSGMIVQFAVFSLLTSAMVLVLERKGKTLERLCTTPISRAEIIGGHVLMFLFSALGGA